MAIAARTLKFTDPCSLQRIEVHYFVTRSEEDDFVDIEYEDLNTNISPEAAGMLSRKLRFLLKWVETEEGKKKIGRLRKKEQKL